MSAGDSILKARVLIAKYNKNHDAKGRFASGPSAADIIKQAKTHVFRWINEKEHESLKTNGKLQARTSNARNQGGKVFFGDYPEGDYVRSRGKWYLVSVPRKVIGAEPLSPGSLRYHTADLVAAKHVTVHGPYTSSQAWKLGNAVWDARHDTFIKKGTNVFESDALSKAYEVLSKFNPYHDRRGLFASGPGGRTAGAPMRVNAMDGLRNATGGGTGGKKLTQAQKDRDVEGLSDAQYKRYMKAPAHLDHTAAMKFATETRGRPPVQTKPAPPKPKAAGPDKFTWPDPGKQDGDGGRSYKDMRPATHEERRNGIVDADGNRYAIPPAWRDVWVAKSSSGRIGARGAATLAQGAAANGKIQTIQPKAHKVKADAEKFDRVASLAKELPKIDKKLSAAIKSGDQRAIALGIIRQTGMRIGSQAEGGKSVKRNKATGEVTVESTFGITNLQARHVTMTTKGARLKFTGKSGMSLDVTVKGPKELVDAIRGLKNASAGKAGTTPFFNTTTVNHSSVTNYTKTVAGDFKNHDFRTLKANVEAARVVASMPKPKTLKELEAARKKVGAEVGLIIGDTPSTTLNSYISGKVFADWESGIA
jgi:DNA topoisomerase-1